MTVLTLGRSTDTRKEHWTMTRIKRITSILSWFFIAVMTLSLVSMLLSAKITGKKSVFGFMPMIVASESMLPIYEVGDIIVGKPITASELQVGDVAAYKLTSPVTDQVSVTIVHRVVDVTEDGLVFKGDNNEECDALVKPEQVLYKIVYPGGEGYE